MSAPPEVVFDTATDPARPWLPEPLGSAARGRSGAPDDTGALTAEWGTGGSPPWAALRVLPEATGGAAAGLEVEVADDADDDAAGLADRCLAMLEQQVSDELSAS
jgi:hypothetical protein